MNRSQTILISGASGLVGRPLCRHLEKAGHRVRRLSRGPGGDFQWDPDAGLLPPEAMEGVDAIIHLAGESVAQRWTEDVKQRILNSRVKGTALLVERALAAGRRPVFLSASGINYYGYDRDGLVDEDSSRGRGFLTEVCHRWESAAEPLAGAGGRCVFLRTGIVLSAEGGALAKMLPPFKLGLGGRLGDGRQMMSWVDLDDLIRMYVACLDNPEIEGPVNAVAPEPLTNAAFTRTLGKVIGRPTFLPVPQSLVRMVFGEMSEETILSNLAVSPKYLQNHSFTWEFPDLEAAIKKQLS